VQQSSQLGRHAEVRQRRDPDLHERRPAQLARRSFRRRQGLGPRRPRQIKAEPASLLGEKIGDNEIHLHVSDNHQGDLIKAVKTRGRTVSNIEVAVKSDITCHLTYIAMCLGRKLRWDPTREEFVNDPEANARMSRVMRSPWHL
jgi:hypothetical protein